MADNYVQIKIKANDDAKPDLTALKFSLDELGAKVETAAVDIDDKDATAKLLDLNARLADLNRKVSNPKITAAGAARVEAQIAVIDAGLDKLNDKHAKPEVTLKGAAEVLAEVEALDHELDKMNRKADNAGPGGLLGRIIGGAGGAVPSEGIFGTLLGPAGLAIVPALGAILVEVTGLVSGFAAAGAGAGSFALLAAPAVKQVETAYTNLSAAQAKYQQAQAKEAADPTKANEKALQAAKLNLQLAQDAIKKMPADAQGAIGSIHDLVSEFSNMSQTLAPDVFKVFNAGLKVVKEVLPAVLPFAATFADVLAKLLGQAGKFAGSKGFQDWIGQFHSLEGPALNSIGQGIGKVVVAIGKLLTVMSGKDVAHAINIAFGTVTVVIDAITFAVRRLMQNWDGMSSTAVRDAHQVAQSFDAMRHDVSNAFDIVRHFIAGAGHDIADDFDQLRRAAASLAHNIASYFDEIRANAARWAADVGRDVTTVVGWFRALPGRILAAIGNFGSLLFNAGKALIQGLINGIESMMGTLGHVASSIGHFIASLKGPLPADLLLLVPHGQAIMQGLMNGMASRMPDLRGQLEGISGTIAGSRFAAPAGAAAAGGAGAVQIQIAPGAGSSGLEQQFWAWLKNGVRAQGGDPNMFTRKVAFL